MNENHIKFSKKLNNIAGVLNMPSKMKKTLFVLIINDHSLLRLKILVSILLFSTLLIKVLLVVELLSIIKIKSEIRHLILLLESRLIGLELLWLSHFLFSMCKFASRFVLASTY